MKLKKLAVIPAIAIALSASMFTTGCGNPADQKFTTDSISYADSLTLSGSKAYCSMEVAYPATGNAAFVDSVKMWIARQLAVSPIATCGPSATPDYTTITDGNELLRTVSTDLMTQARSDFEGYAKDSFTINYEFYWNIRPVCDSTRFVTYASSTYAYLGGAHGGTGYQPATFDKSDGQIYGWNMFVADSLPALRNMVKERIMTEYFQVNSQEKFRDCLLLNPDTMPLPATPPCFMPTGVDFTYMQYEIAPYAAGMPGCIIDYATISPMLTKQARELLK